MLVRWVKLYREGCNREYMGSFQYYSAKYYNRYLFWIRLPKGILYWIFIGEVDWNTILDLD